MVGLRCLFNGDEVQNQRVSKAFSLFTLEREEHILY